MEPSSDKTATLYRMSMPQHQCPFGLKTLDLLKRKGFKVKDHTLNSRPEVDAFKASQDVSTTPQVFINSKRIGGYEDLLSYLGEGQKSASNQSTYAPVGALFSITFLMAVSTSLLISETPFSWITLKLFIAFSMCVLALLKLQDLESFSTMFLNYDLLARKWVPYSYVYPFAEGIAGILMISGTLTPLASSIALFIGTIGAASVFKAVYVDKRELKCACVGGNSKVPLGFISLTENLMMIGMGLTMLWRFIP